MADRSHGVRSIDFPCTKKREWVSGHFVETQRIGLFSYHGCQAPICVLGGMVQRSESIEDANSQAGFVSDDVLPKRSSRAAEMFSNFNVRDQP